MPQTQSNLWVWVRYTHRPRPWLTRVFSGGETIQTALEWVHRMVMSRPDVQSVVIERQYKATTYTVAGSADE